MTNEQIFAEGFTSACADRGANPVLLLHGLVFEPTMRKQAVRMNPKGIYTGAYPAVGTPPKPVGAPSVGVDALKTSPLAPSQLKVTQPNARNSLPPPLPRSRPEGVNAQVPTNPAIPTIRPGPENPAPNSTNTNAVPDPLSPGHMSSRLRQMLADRAARQPTTPTVPKPTPSVRSQPALSGPPSDAWLSKTTPSSKPTALSLSNMSESLPLSTTPGLSAGSYSPPAFDAGNAWRLTSPAAPEAPVVTPAVKQPPAPAVEQPPAPAVEQPPTPAPQAEYTRREWPALREPEELKLPPSQDARQAFPLLRDQEELQVSPPLNPPQEPNLTLPPANNAARMERSSGVLSRERLQAEQAAKPVAQYPGIMSDADMTAQTQAALSGHRPGGTGIFVRGPDGQKREWSSGMSTGARVAQRAPVAAPPTQEQRVNDYRNQQGLDYQRRQAAFTRQPSEDSPEMIRYRRQVADRDAHYSRAATQELEAAKRTNYNPATGRYDPTTYNPKTGQLEFDKTSNEKRFADGFVNRCVARGIDPATFIKAAQKKPTYTAAERAYIKKLKRPSLIRRLITGGLVGSLTGGVIAPIASGSGRALIDHFESPNSKYMPEMVQRDRVKALLTDMLSGAQNGAMLGGGANALLG